MISILKKARRGFHSRYEFGSPKADFRAKSFKEKVVEEAEKQVTVVHGSNALEEYRKEKPKYARMLERGTATIHKCANCGKAYVIAKYRDGKRLCWPCFSGQPSTFSEALQHIIEKLYQDWLDYINQGVKTTYNLKNSHE